ncbi:sugar transferase [Hirschia litorea]|uniref:Sugar transferase n=1 Tax=Hirschia litorea TaxID=1199156 RepID=A0ABW2IQ71_9PROT
MLRYIPDNEQCNVSNECYYIHEGSNRRPVVAPSNANKTNYKKSAGEKPIGGKVKRCFDFSLALLLLLFLSPFMVMIWAFVRLESKGPGLFKQARGGVHGKAFEIYKFRTMRQHDASFKQAVRGDERITRLGRFLRKTSIDELPQLLNVLKGEMSLVGPRPHVVAHDAEFMAFDSRYALRFQARPGVTGLAQVSGSRGPTDTEELKLKRIELDLDYVEGWSHKKDFYVLIKTACLVLFDNKAF